MNTEYGMIKQATTSRTILFTPLIRNETIYLTNMLHFSGNKFLHLIIKRNNDGLFKEVFNSLNLLNKNRLLLPYTKFWTQYSQAHCHDIADTVFSEKEYCLASYIKGSRYAAIARNGVFGGDKCQRLDGRQ